MSESGTHRRMGIVEMMFWTQSVLALMYFGSFALLLCDHFAFKGGMIENPLRQANPALADQVGQAIRVVYSPLLWGMKQLQMLPD